MISHEGSPVRARVLVKHQSIIKGARRGTFAAACWCAPVLVLVACTSRPEQLVPLRVAALNPLTGGLASIAPAWNDAQTLAAEHVNASGGVLDGRPLDLVSLDSSAGGPDDDGTAAASAALNEGAVALIGTATSGQSTAVLRDVINAAQVPMVSCCATDTRLTALAPPNDGFFFRTVPSDRLQSRAFALSAQAYDAVMVLALAFAIAKTEDGGAVRTALFQASASEGGVTVEGPLLGEAFAALQRGDRIDYAGPSGELTFDAYGDVRHGQFVLWQVEDSAGGAGIVERGLLDP